MSRRFSGWLVSIVCGLLVVPAWAETRDWNAGSGDWSNGDNWLPVGVPADGDGVNIVFADDVARTVSFDATVAIDQYRLDMAGMGTNASTLSITDGSLSTASAYIGEVGRGTIDQTAGSYVAQGQGLFVGTADGSVGTYNLSMSGSLQTKNFYLGNAGTGNFNQSGGSVTTSDGDQLYLGFLQTGVGNYTLTGGSLSAVENEYVGYAGTGNFEHSGGMNNVAHILYVGAQPDGIGTYTLSNTGQLSASEIVVGDFGTGSFSHSGGTAATPHLIVGHQDGALGTYTLTGGGTLTVGTALIGSVAAGSESQTGGTFVQSGGSHYVDTLYVGAIGTGSYVLNSGALVTSLTASIGHEGTGTLSQNGGSHTANSITIGHLAGSNGAYNVNGGILNAASIYVGGSSDGAGGTGVLSISGTSTSVTVPGTIKVYNTPESDFNFHGGTLNVGAIDVGGVPSNFHWTGGTLHVTGDVAWSAGEPANSTGAIFGSQLQLASNRTLRVTGNEAIGGNGQFNLSLGNGTHSVTGTITLKPGGTISTTSTSTLSYTNFVQAGGTIGSFFRNTATFHYQSGTINAQFVNSGTLTTASTMTVGGTMQNDGSVTVGAGQALAVQGPLTNSGNFTLEGGTISASSTFTNAAGGRISGRGTLGTSSQFFNRGMISINGVLAYGSFSSFSNEGVIEGVGTLSNTNGQLSNSAGAVINSTTSGGTLVINAFQNNNTGGVINVGPTSTLSIGTPWTNSGIVNLQGPGARLTGTSVNNMGTLQGSGTITSNMTQQSGTIRAMGGDLYLTAANISMSSTSQLQVLAGSSMTFLQGHAVNQGTISLTGGTFDNSGKTMNNQGTINGHGVFRTGGLTNSSSRLISVGGGDMEFFGNVTNQGVVNIQSGRSAYFFNNVSGSGAFTGGGTAVFLGSLSPGSSPGSVSFGGNVELVGGISLNIELGGLAPGTGFDRVQVAGQLSIGGILSLSLINGFSPSAGDTFDILDWGTLDGTFSSVVLPNLGPVMTWDASNLYTNGVLSVMSVALPGDHNLDSAVDAADYVMWRKTDSGNAQGYADWLANFGTTSGSGGLTESSESVHVPEPTTGILLLFALVALATYRRTA